MPRFLELYEGVSGEPPVLADDPDAIEIGFADEFEELSQEWVLEPGLGVTVDDGVALLEVLPDSPVPWPAMAREITVDVDVTPVLRVALPSVSGQWALKLNDGGAVDIDVQPGSSAGGVHSFDIAALTGWSGEQTFSIKLFAVGGDASIAVESVRVQGQQAGFVDNFSSETLEWDVGQGLETVLADGTLRITVGPDSAHGFGAVQRGVDVDLDAFPVLRLALPSVDGDWALKVNNGSGDDVDLEPGSNASGVFSFDVPAATGWSGSQSFTIKLFAVGGGAEIVVDSVRLVSASQGQEWVRGAAEYENFWSPASLDFSATYPGGAAVSGADAMVGLDSVVREFEIDQAPGEGEVLRVAGSFVGAVEVDADAGVITVAGDHVRYAVAIPGMEDVYFFESIEELEAGGPASSEPTSRMGVWAAAVPESASQVRIGAGFSVDDNAQAVARAQAAAATPIADARAELVSFWADALAGVPHPQDFSLLGVADDGGLSDDQVRSAYYRAFVALYSNVLPPQPETGFAYRTVATGKPSMWNHGAPGAQSAAAWESFIGVQFLAYVDPEAAWDSFNGLMSLVDEDGSLAGESLPSRKAQAAWVLYAMTGQSQELAYSYDALIRLLQWQADNPRWIYGAYDNPGERDSEFVTTLIIDIDYGIQIAEVLGHDDDIDMLNDLREELLTGYHHHYWDTPHDVPPRQYLFPGDPDCSVRGGCYGNLFQTTMALHVDGLEEQRADALLAFFDSVYDPAAQFAGTADVKYPNMSYTVYGLLDHGRSQDAQTLTSAVLREIIGSGSFAEAYDPSEDGPVPVGVRPSIFGLATVIDAVWLNNGYRMDLGDPHALLAPAATGGLHGITYRGQTLNTEVNAAAGEVTFSGPAVAATEECNTITGVQVGTTIALPTQCEGTDPDPTDPDPTDPDPTDPDPTDPPGEPVATPDEELGEDVRGDVSVPESAERGETIDVTVPSASGEQVRVWLHSDPVLLTTGDVSADGTIAATIPEGATLGDHRIVVQWADGELIGWAPIEIVAAPVSGGGVDGAGAAGGDAAGKYGALPNTGAGGSTHLALAAITAMLLGGLILAVRHRALTAGR
ncbi:LPXTG cell wall anchor domain-containing protein [Bogoriella caseilytica]|nr:LPXTG cell wall anchor domain-containing protein [Bogoriella caseilytica]